MHHSTLFQSNSTITERGELFSMLLRLHPVKAGWVSPSSGSRAQLPFWTSFTRMIRLLAELLHQPNQRRPFTVGLFKDSTTCLKRK